MKIKLLIFLVLPILVMTSTVGIYFIEGISNSSFSSLFNSLWWTIVTFTTVGYGDVSPITVEGKIFGILIMATGVIINSIIISIISNWFFSFQSGKARGIKPVFMRDHILVCSDDENFIHAIIQENSKLVKDNRLVVIYPHKENPLLTTIYKNIPWVYGAASNNNTLKMASAQEAITAYISYKDDSNSVMSVMSVEDYSNQKINSLVRFEDDEFTNHFTNVGCDYALDTFQIYVPLMVNAFFSEAIPKWITALILSSDETPTLQKKVLSTAYDGYKWLDFILEEKEKKNNLPIALYDSGKNLLINPDIDYRLASGAEIFSISPITKNKSESSTTEIEPNELPKKGHILICSDIAVFIRKVLTELKAAHIKEDIVVISELEKSAIKSNFKYELIHLPSYSDEGFKKADAETAKAVFIDHRYDNHTLMAVLRLEKITNGKIYSIASFREDEFGKKLKRVGADFSINANLLTSPILSQTSQHPGLGLIIERIISQEKHHKSLFIKELPQKWTSKSWLETIREMQTKFRHLPIGLLKYGTTLVYNPRVEDIVDSTDKIIFLSAFDNYEPKINSE